MKDDFIEKLIVVILMLLVIWGVTIVAVGCASLIMNLFRG